MSDYLRLPVVGLKANLTDWFEQTLTWDRFVQGTDEEFADLLITELHSLSAERRRALCRCGKSVAITPLGLYYTHNRPGRAARCPGSKTRVEQ